MVVAVEVEEEEVDGDGECFANEQDDCDDRQGQT